MFVLANISAVAAEKAKTEPKRLRIYRCRGMNWGLTGGWDVGGSQEVTWDNKNKQTVHQAPER